MLFSPETLATGLLVYAVLAVVWGLWPVKPIVFLYGAASVALGLLVQAWALTVVGVTTWLAFAVVLVVTFSVAAFNTWRSRAE